MIASDGSGGSGGCRLVQVRFVFEQHFGFSHGSPPLSAT